MIDAPMVFYPLQPNPIVNPIEGIALAKQARYEVVIREVGMEDSPAGQDPLPEKPAGQQCAGHRLDTA